jgi:hypothetical protein
MTGPAVKAAALVEFLDVWGDGMLLSDLGPRLTCREADALIDLFRTHEQPAMAETLLDAHRLGDGEGDSHYTATCGADSLHGTGFGVCGAELDEHGVCPRADRHVETLNPL